MHLNDTPGRLMHGNLEQLGFILIQIYEIGQPAGIH